MQTKLIKIPLKPGSRAAVDKLIHYMKSSPELPFNEMNQKGYFWDSVFLDAQFNLYIVIKSPDFSSVMLNNDDLVETDFRSMYETFRQQAWQSDAYEDIEALACFNQALTFEQFEVTTPPT